MMITADKPQLLSSPAPAADTLRAGWVAQYRSEVPAADRWACGLRHRAHSIKTQERVFRMAQQLVDQGVDRQGLFNNLEEADRSVATADAPEVVGTAGYRAIAPLLPLVGAPIVICGDDGLPDLNAFGFETIPFDGYDPAAYAWAMFELTMRARADCGAQQCSCHPRASTSVIGLAQRQRVIRMNDDGRTRREHTGDSGHSLREEGPHSATPSDAALPWR